MTLLMKPLATIPDATTLVALSPPRLSAARTMTSIRCVTSPHADALTLSSKAVKEAKSRFRISSRSISAGASNKYDSVISSALRTFSLPSSKMANRCGASERSSDEAGAAVCTSTAAQRSRASSSR